MKGIWFYLLIMLRISVLSEDPVNAASYGIISGIHHEMENQALSPMEALDLVKERYAANFDKVYEKAEDKYYFKLAFAKYYLEYEGEVGTDKDYLVHLYEFVIDEPDTGMGHTVTYGWYTVDRKSGAILEKTE
jgi:hypothetical protein